MLRSNKEVLRAYIRELDSYGPREDGAAPSVRGLLSNSSSSQYPTPPVPAVPVSYTDPEALSPKESFHKFDNEKFSPDVKLARPVPGQVTRPQALDPRVPQSLQPYYRSQPEPQSKNATPPVYNQQSSNLSYEQHHSTDTSDTDSQSSSQEMAIISTRDLMNMDYRQAELLAARMGAMRMGPSRQLPPNNDFAPGSPAGDGKYLPPATERLSIMSSDEPRYLPPYPLDESGALSPTSSAPTPPPAYGTSPTALAMPALPKSNTGLGPPNVAQRFSRLAPDSQGREIPLDAKWTRIKRSLVSPVVLDKAGVRYEARPEFVAVLGVIPREKIQEWARQSAQVRKARQQHYKDEKRDDPQDRTTSKDDKRAERRQNPIPGSYSTRREETYSDRDRQRRKGNGSSTSDSDVLWDESDTTEDDDTTAKIDIGETSTYPATEVGMTETAVRAIEMIGTTRTTKEAPGSSQSSYLRLPPLEGVIGVAFPVPCSQSPS